MHILLLSHSVNSDGNAHELLTDHLKESGHTYSCQPWNAFDKAADYDMVMFAANDYYADILALPVVAEKLKSQNAKVVNAPQQRFNIGELNATNLTAEENRAAIYAKLYAPYLRLSDPYRAEYFVKLLGVTNDIYPSNDQDDYVILGGPAKKEFRQHFAQRANSMLAFCQEPEAIENLAAIYAASNQTEQACMEAILFDQLDIRNIERLNSHIKTLKPDVIKTALNNPELDLDTIEDCKESLLIINQIYTENQRIVADSLGLQLVSDSTITAA